MERDQRAGRFSLRCRVATTRNVYQNSSATVHAAYQNLNGQGSFNVLNVGHDDYGAYAGDAIDDGWQVTYFGQPPNALAGPNADPDGSGRTNLFKFVTGLNPLNGSRFTLEIRAVPGQSSRKQLVFAPIVSGRTYDVRFSSGLTSPDWQPVTNSTQSDNGAVRTVLDLSASPASPYYRVQIFQNP